MYATSHPLGLTLNDEGVCSGCLIHEEKNELNWGERWEQLKQIVKPYRSKSGDSYDCIIPVSGGQDSHYIVYLAKVKLGLNPLLVTYNKYFNTPIGIRNLTNLRMRFNCDILYQNVNPVSVKNITRSTLRELGSVYWPVIAGQTVFPVQIAVNFKVPLIIWGAHQGVEQVGMFSHMQEVEMTRRYRKDHDLMGREADDLLSVFDTLKESDIWQYRYPDDHELKSIGVRGIYLGNYVRWDPKSQHDQMVSEYGYNSTHLSRTFDCYDHVDCFNYINLHDQLKLYKHGFSKVTDHATREIRHGRLTRSQGIKLVKKYERNSVQFSELFLEWLGITPRAMEFLMDRFRNKNFWHQPKFGQWEFRGWSERHNLNDVEQHNDDFHLNNYLINDELSKNSKTKYVTFGKGYP